MQEAPAINTTIDTSFLLQKIKILDGVPRKSELTADDSSRWILMPTKTVI